MQQVAPYLEPAQFLTSVQARCATKCADRTATAEETSKVLDFPLKFQRETSVSNLAWQVPGSTNDAKVKGLARHLMQKWGVGISKKLESRRMAAEDVDCLHEQVSKSLARNNASNPILLSESYLKFQELKKVFDTWLEKRGATRNLWSELKPIWDIKWKSAAKPSILDLLDL
eukprot:145366-Karenia_brevis.AAC.1